MKLKDVRNCLILLISLLYSCANGYDGEIKPSYKVYIVEYNNTERIATYLKVKTDNIVVVWFNECNGCPTIKDRLHKETKFYETRLEHKPINSYDI